MSLLSAALEFDSPEKLELLAKALNSSAMNIEFSAADNDRVQLSFNMPIYDALILQDEE